MNIYRHGDVLIQEVKTVPEGAKTTKKGKEVTIALGEATGHHHTLYGNLPIELLEYKESRYLKIQEEVSLKHQEHYCLTICPGTYEIVVEREHDYFTNEIKKVVD